MNCPDRLFIVIIPCFFLIGSTGLAAQKAGPHILITQNDLKAAAISNKIYSKNSLWGYINGGADLYLEYGFENLYLQHIRLHNRNYKIEFYEMTDPNAAFGIYSVSTHHGRNIDSLPLTNCVMPYQIQVIWDKYYISIINEKGTPDEQSDCMVFLNIIIRKVNKPTCYSIPAIFTDSLYISHRNNLKFIKGMLGLQNGYPVWCERMESFNHYQMFILPVQADSHSFTASVISFTDSADMRRFYTQEGFEAATGQWTVKKTNNLSHYIQIQSPHTILYCETDFQEKDAVRYVTALLRK